MNALVQLIAEPQIDHPLRADLAEEYQRDKNKFNKNAGIFKFRKTLHKMSIILPNFQRNTRRSMPRSVARHIWMRQTTRGHWLEEGKKEGSSIQQSIAAYQTWSSFACSHHLKIPWYICLILLLHSQCHVTYSYLHNTLFCSPKCDPLFLMTSCTPKHYIALALFVHP